MYDGERESVQVPDDRERRSQCNPVGNRVTNDSAKDKQCDGDVEENRHHEREGECDEARPDKGAVLNNIKGAITRLQHSSTTAPFDADQNAKAVEVSAPRAARPRPACEMTTSRRFSSPTLVSPYLSRGLTAVVTALPTTVSRKTIATGVIHYSVGGSNSSTPGVSLAHFNASSSACGSAPDSPKN